VERRGGRRADVALVDPAGEVDRGRQHPEDAGHCGAREGEPRQLGTGSDSGRKALAEPGDEGHEAEAAEHEEPAAEHDRVRVGLVPGEDLAPRCVVGRAVVIYEDDPDDPEGKCERADEGPAAVV